MKDTFYFSHDSNAKDDPKCVGLIESLGLEGYGIYWVLLEILREQPEYSYPMKLIPAIARRYNTTAEKVKAVVCGFELFTVDEEKGDFRSESLIRRMQPLNEMRERRSQAGIRGNEVRWSAKRLQNSDTAIAEQSQSDNNAIQTQSQCDRKTSLSKVKESKVKKSKVNNIKKEIAKAIKKEEHAADAAEREEQKKDENSGLQPETAARKSDFYDSLRPFIDKYKPAMLRDFFNYWSEPNKSGSKMRFELERTWDVGLRLSNWARREIVEKEKKEDMSLSKRMEIGVVLTNNSPDKYKDSEW